jgi:hypothetical protein
VGKKRLGYNPQQRALAHDRRAVKKLPLDGQREADKGEPRKPSGGVSDEVFQGAQRRLLEALMVKKIGAGIAGQTQLGKNQDGDVLVLSAFHHGQDALRVEATVRNPD